MKKKLITITMIALSLMSTNVFAAVTEDGINQAYTTPGAAQIELSDIKTKQAEDYVKNKSNQAKKGISTMSAGSSKVNAVGTMRQSLGYTCGPASARNLINGYIWNKGSGTVPTESTLATSLGTTTAGTGFDANPWQNTLNTYAPGNNYTLTWGTSSGWSSKLANNVMYTIDKSGNYNVIADLNHGSTSTPVNPIYKNGAAHYICVYGYNDTAKTYNIADSNSAAPVTYTTPYTNLANSTQSRGIVW